MTSSRRLVLVRHAKSDYPGGVADHDRPLSARGRVDAPQIGAWLEHNVGVPQGQPALVLVSSANRAQLTWSLASSRLGMSWQSRVERTEPRIYEASVRALLSLVDETSDEVSTLVIVGHNPGLLDLIEQLGAMSPAVLAATEKFPTSAIAVLETADTWAVATSEERSWDVSGFAVPRG